MVCAPPRLAYKSIPNFFHEGEVRAVDFLCFLRQKRARERELWGQLPEPEMRSEGLRKSMLHPVEEPSTEYQSSDTVNSLLTETFLKQTPRVSPCVFKSFFNGLKDVHFYKTNTHWATVVSVLVKGDCIFAVLFIFIISWFKRHGQGTEILSCATEYEGRWKENRKHGPGTKKLKTGMTEEQVGIQTLENQLFRLENQMVRAIPFGKLQKIWAVIWGDAFFSTLFSLFSWFGYIVAGRPPTTSNSIVLCSCPNYHPGSLCKWWTKSQLVTHCLIFVDQQILLLN